MELIKSVVENSPASRAGLAAGDMLVKINGHEVNDILDYGFYSTERELVLTVSRDCDLFEVHIKKRQYDDLGLEFSSALMDNKHRCTNNCVFCFIDQLPKGLREPLYFKDDDERLSFLHGNYITMTNLTERDIDRIIEMKISPVNVSVHTTDPELRCLMMRNRFAGNVMQRLRRLADGGTSLHCQIVLCKGLNDGEQLKRTMTDLASLYPSIDSVSIVPVGLSGHREGLYPLIPFNAHDCVEVISAVDAFAGCCIEGYGRRIFYCADEFYITAGIEIPDTKYYDDFPQIQNGVGMLRDFENGVNDALECGELDFSSVKREISVATGEAAACFIKSQIEKLHKVCYNLNCRVYTVKNNFFGGGVTVTGLLTATDIKKQLENKMLGDTLYISRSMLRAQGDIFLDDSTPDNLTEALGVPVVTVENDGYEFVKAICGF